MAPFYPGIYGRVTNITAGSVGTDYQALCDNGPVQTVRQRGCNQYAGKSRPTKSGDHGFLQIHGGILTEYRVFIFCNTGRLNQRIHLKQNYWNYTENNLYPQEKMDAISYTIFSDAFAWVKFFILWLKFHWCLFLLAHFAITQHWFR